MAPRRTQTKTKKQLSGLLKERDVVVDAIEKLEALLRTLKAKTPKASLGRPAKKKVGRPKKATKKASKKTASKKTTKKKVSKKVGRKKVAKKRGRPPLRR